MRLSRLALLSICCIWTFSSAAFAAAPSARAVTVEADGKVLFAGEESLLGKVGDSDMTYFVLDESDAQKAGKGATIFFFDKDGKKLLHEFSPSPEVFEVEKCAAVSLSPKGDIVAFDNGTWVVRSWSFFAFPSFEPLDKHVTYYSVENSEKLVWVDNNTVMLTNIHEPEARPRQCNYDPCGNSSVVLYSIGSGTTTPVFAGTDLCDYQLIAFDGATVTAAKKCAKKAEDWADVTVKEKFTLASETATLPAR